ncbi:MAG: hypothetical protein ABUT20_38575 [Bacteroidota bacterium]
MAVNPIATGQNISQKYPELIKRIKSINQDSSFEKVILYNEEFMNQMSDGGGELIGYFKNDEPQKIIKKIGLSYGIETFDYYFTNGSLIFIYETLNGFVYNDSLEKFDYTKTENNFIGRYYFKNNKLFDSETTGHNRFDGEGFENGKLDMGTVLIKEMRESLETLKRKKAKIKS